MRIYAAAITALGLSGAVLPAGSAHAASKPPVVRIVLDNGMGKISGAKGLKAGWVTFRVSTTDGVPHDLQVNAPQSGTTKGIRPPQTIRRAAPRAGTAAAPSKAEMYREQADAQRHLDAARWLGGVQVPAKGTIDLTMRLRPGITWITDLAGAYLEIKAATTSSSARPGHSDVLVSEGVDNKISSPATLPRSGTVQFLNTNARGTQSHEILLALLRHGATKTSIEKYFAPNGYEHHPIPYTDNPVSGQFNCLSPGGSDYITYRNLKPGKYALIDVAFDQKTGHNHAEDGSIRFVTVK